MSEIPGPDVEVEGLQRDDPAEMLGQA